MMYNNKMVASIKVDGKIMREDRETVYLPFGSEYSMLLKNLNSKKAKVIIEIDGQDVVPNGLIIEPNQSIDLERFIVNGNMNEGPKFKFIEKTEQISEYRGDRVEDGIVRISYQFESITPISYTYHYTNVYGGGIYDTMYKGGLDGVSISSDTTRSIGGITTHGETSGQQFSYGNIGLLECQEHVICLQLKGHIGEHVVVAPVTVKRKIRCNVCGKSNLVGCNKFCPDCGTNLTYQY